ncbi:hypothetical protein L0P88_15695 [Muricauda sp. SCSIO 64092]|uniref:hypothetical protein n=1 Tax=Allomuricauda sp. SCSIO 64092 TaxID=2908842 RepID=UPI001FF5869A|nr:hypothetical protein [Muricauda sp. SCSIO 64092]UOY05389.1 hypothetical protein L0P88_15695 [Muricauda sp. SCSIO 64092]
MINLKYPGNQSSLKRLVERKVKQWSDIDYITATEASNLNEKYSDKRKSTNLSIRTLLFSATTVFLLGGTYLIGLLITELNPTALFVIGTGTLFIYEVYIGKRYNQAGMDKALILIGGLFLIASILWIFNENKIQNPIQFLIVALVAWVIAIRYHNYIAIYSAFVLLQTCLFEYIRMSFSFEVFIITSIVSTLCFALYFSKRREEIPPFSLRWNETLEVFFLLMVMAFLNPILQESLYTIFKNENHGDSIAYFNTYALVLMILLKAIFATVLMVLGVLRQVRAYLIVAMCTLFVGLLTTWYYFFQELNENMIYTISGMIIIFLGLFLNYYLATPKWKLTSRKISHQNNLAHVFEKVEKITKKMELN